MLNKYGFSVINFVSSVNNVVLVRNVQDARFAQTVHWNFHNFTLLFQTLKNEEIEETRQECTTLGYAFDARHAKLAFSEPKQHNRTKRTIQ